ncbi:hypothetical protein [Halogeometricum limi]|uniref:hypothetical protein n=1 Tax=Halogeometricum limi TaxID=555875 RepID=UPI001113E576|nr:hypothetical protein [Halogeometricum limi]
MSLATQVQQQWKGVVDWGSGSDDESDDGEEAKGPIHRARLIYFLALSGVTFGIAGTFLVALRLAPDITAWLQQPATADIWALSVWMLVALLFAVGVGAVYAYPLVRPTALEETSYRRVERTVRYGLFVAILLGGLFAVFEATLDPTLGRGAVVVALALGVVVALALFGSYPSGTQRQYELAVEGYRTTLDAFERHLDELTTNVPFSTVYYEDPKLRFDVEQARVALAEANARLTVADEAIAERLYEAYVFHYQAAKRETITIEYAIREFESRAGALRTPYRTDGGALPRLPARLSTVLPKLRRRDSPTPQNDYLTAMAERTLDWADESLPAARASHLRRLLTTTPTEGEASAVRTDLTPTDLRVATARIHDYLLSEQQKQFAVKRLMRAGSVFGAVALGVAFLLADSGALTGVVPSVGGASPALSLAIVGLFGFLGAVTSSLFALRDISAGTATDSELTNPFLNVEILSMRLVVGSTAGVIAAVLLASGLSEVVLNPDLIDESGVAASVVVVAAFLAGFTERLVLRSAEKLVAKPPQ